MTRLAPWLLAGSLSCTGGPPKTSTTDTATPPSVDSGSPSTGQTGDTGALTPPWQVGDCETSTAGAPPLTPRLLYANVSDSDYGLYYNPYLELPVGPDVTVLASDQDYQAWLLPGRPALDDSGLDFATEIAVVGTYHIPSSCGIQLGSVTAVDAGGKAHVSMELLDMSYACMFPCNASHDIVWAVAVPRGTTGEATACLSVGGGCGALP